MAKVIHHRFKNTYYESGLPKYLAGKTYPPDAITKAELLGGNVDEVEVEVEKEPAAKPASRSEKE